MYTLLKQSVILILLLSPTSSINTNVFELVKYEHYINTALRQILNFIYEHYDEMNFDVVVALTLTKAQLEETLNYHLTIEESYTFKQLIKQCDSTLEIALRNISKRSPISSMFEQYLLNPNIWIINNNFLINELDDLGKYDRWTTAFIIKNRSAKYKNVSSNECLHELLQQTPKDFAEHQCYSSDRCKEFMFGNRIDTGYVLTHRLLYLYIMRMVRCSISSKDADLLTNKYCSLILKEAKTNEFLGFPQRDIFLEQVTFCGLAGFTEFLNTKWIKSILQWKTKNGCYKDGKHLTKPFNTRSANVISFGCVDHTTGLASSALAINLRYIVHKLHFDLVK